MWLRDLALLPLFRLFAACGLPASFGQRAGLLVQDLKLLRALK
ncbi:MAG: hypothetical protein Q7T25_09285 [Sideroxyarcus sp.]|nr:hypothetical protein [Sideroxyarcus sp.]